MDERRLIRTNDTKLPGGWVSNRLIAVPNAANPNVFKVVGFPTPTNTEKTLDYPMTVSLPDNLIFSNEPYTPLPILPAI